MTPRGQIALVIGVFAAFGVGVSVVIIALGGGFTAGVDFFNPPGSDDIYVLGAQIEDDTEFTYTLTSIGPNTSLVDAEVTIAFERQENFWRTHFSIINGTQTASNFDVLFSDHMTKIGQPEVQFRPILEPVELSIFAIRDMDYRGNDKYLAVGSPWDIIFYGTSSATVRITAHEAVQTPADTFDAFLLSYTLGENTSRIWIVRDLPLPVKAEVYDPNDELLYQYELVSLRR